MYEIFIFISLRSYERDIEHSEEPRPTRDHSHTYIHCIYSAPSTITAEKLSAR